MAASAAVTGWGMEAEGGTALGRGAQTVSGLLDAMTTRMLIGGAGSLGAAEFEELARAAEAQALAAVATEAIQTAVAVASSSADTRAQVVVEGVERLRGLISAANVGPVLVAPQPAPSLPQQPATEAQSQSEPEPQSDPGLTAFSADVEMVAEFVTEASEHLVAIEEKLLDLEKDASSVEDINAVFRGFHTIKGLAGFLEFGAIQQVAHEVETLLDLARIGKLALHAAVVDVVLESMDYLRGEIAAISHQLKGAPPRAAASNHALLERVRAASKGSAVAAPVEAVPAIEPSSEAKPEQPTPQVEPIQPAPAATAEPQAAAPAPPVPPAQPPAAQPIREERRATDSSSVRIDTAKLDHLMNMVGEMVIAQTLVSHHPIFAGMKDTRLIGDLAQLTRITADVQKVTTSMRMVPIGTQFQKTARLVRDLSRKAGKDITLVTSGEDTELDKTIAEELSDPLLHMVRNSIDHGIETPEERAKTTKDKTAQIRLAAYHQSGQIVIEIGDDGRGLNKDRILAKATERGIVKPGAQLTDNEIFLLIFEAGFSTADKITDISGRGVGMDVVRKHVQHLRGRIEIQSEQGKGTTFFLKLPLTLAIIEGLVVVVGGSRSILPIPAVIEMFRPTQAVLSTVQGKGEMATVRGRLLPIVRLHQRFGTTPGVHELTDGMLVVAESQGKQFCLFVDEVVGKQEVVIKSLGAMFKEVVGVAGCAILGDGRVGLILDVDGLFSGRL